MIKRTTVLMCTTLFLISSFLRGPEIEQPSCVRQVLGVTAGIAWGIGIGLQLCHRKQQVPSATARVVSSAMQILGARGACECIAISDTNLAKTVDLLVASYAIYHTIRIVNITNDGIRTAAYRDSHNARRREPFCIYTAQGCYRFHGNGTTIHTGPGVFLTFTDGQCNP